MSDFEHSDFDHDLQDALGSKMLENAVPVHKIQGCLAVPWMCLGSTLGSLGDALGAFWGASGSLGAPSGERFLEISSDFLRM